MARECALTSGQVEPKDTYPLADTQEEDNAHRDTWSRGHGTDPCQSVRYDGRSRDRGHRRTDQRACVSAFWWGRVAQAMYRRYAAPCTFSVWSVTRRSRQASRGPSPSLLRCPLATHQVVGPHGS